jgi:hypothetical protein
MILIEVIARKMSKGDATMRMHQDKRILQLMDQKIGVTVPKSEVEEVLKNGGKVLNT